MTHTTEPQPVLDQQEIAAMEYLLSSYKTIKEWGLRANEAELVAAVHVIQNFIVQHMLQRLNPEDWGSWYD